MGRKLGEEGIGGRIIFRGESNVISLCLFVWMMMILVKTFGRHFSLILGLLPSSGTSAVSVNARIISAPMSVAIETLATKETPPAIGFDSLNNWGHYYL